MGKVLNRVRHSGWSQYLFVAVGNSRRSRSKSKKSEHPTPRVWLEPHEQSPQNPSLPRSRNSALIGDALINCPKQKRNSHAAPISDCVFPKTFERFDAPFRFCPTNGRRCGPNAGPLLIHAYLRLCEFDARGSRFVKMAVRILKNVCVWRHQELKTSPVAMVRISSSR